MGVYLNHQSKELHRTKMAKSPIQYSLITFLFNLTVFCDFIPQNYAQPIPKYQDLKNSDSIDGPFLHILEYKSITKDCNQGLHLSKTEAKDLELCVFGNTEVQTNNNKRYWSISDLLQKCFHKISNKNRKYWCNEDKRTLGGNILSLVTRRIQRKVKTGGIRVPFKYHNKQKIQNRPIRELKSESDSEECETKLRQSFECYRSELSSLATSLEEHKSNALTPESQMMRQNEAGCELINNILNKCDQLLCSPSSHSSSNVETYNEYVRTVLPGFDVKKCSKF